ncbi:MAG TPA: 2-C-methyl-D-erythritol 2,4-cyclodiphosphate synthase, partial [candidate division Zixibacteria bacterium]|nr:2-C-methyl-D-erythritol 2,4-cyclodiphosphate synthase [candidate division Zixibacteria bacterium]
LRVGQGFDIHEFAEGRKLVVGGVTIPFERGLLGHSDADVLVHAIMDALLGAAGLPDIGEHFPPSDPRYRNADSLELLKRVNRLIRGGGFESILNIDATILAERPKFAEYIPKMKERIAEALGIEALQVNIKATTAEKLGFVGREEGIAAMAVCLIGRNG